MNYKTVLELLLKDTEYQKQFVELHKQRTQLTRENVLQPYEIGYFQGAEDVLDYFKTSFGALMLALDSCGNNEGLFLKTLEQRVDDRRNAVEKMQERVNRLKNESGNT